MKIHIQNIKNSISKHRETLKNTYSVKRIGVFGSVIKNQNNETSDIDVLVDFAKPVGFFTFLDLEEYLTHLFGKKVDLVTQKALKPLIKEEILSEVKYV